MRILIINSVKISFDENSLTKSGVGGSETWAVQLANAFKKLGHDVAVSSQCTTHYANNGVLYINNSELGHVLKTQKFNLCIISRFYGNLIGPIDSFKSCDNVFIQAHDIEIFGDDFNQVKTLDCFKGVSTLSAYQEKCLRLKNGVDWKYMFRIGNGIDPELFKDLDLTATNKRLLHSSCYYRSGDIMSNIISPILNERDESGVDFCTYDKLPSEEIEKSVKILGSLTKADLYKEMSNRYCWFYPLTADETFCITMIENIMCENDIIAPMNFGCTSVLEPFMPDISMKHNFISGEEEFNAALNEAVYRIEYSYNNREKGEELRKELKSYVLAHYTWEEVAKKWINLIK